jgi:dipeptidyl aminopeptidase/acylaminoacyl peptidase
MTGTTKRLITAEDLYQLKAISGARISPDGQTVVYAVHHVDEKTEKKYANLWIAPADGSQPARQFTYGEQTDSHPRWSPDGETIAFLSNRGDKEKPAQVYLIPFSGGEARPLTSIQGSINTFVWSPNGQRLLLLARKTDAEALEREKDEQKKKLGIVARHYDRLFYKLDGFGYLPKERLHLWTVDVQSGEDRQITDHPVYDESFASWSPDGQWIAFISNRNEDPDAYPDRDDIFIIPSEGGPLRKIETAVGPKQHTSFSPDGKWLAFYASDSEDLGYRNMNVWVAPVNGSAPACNLTGPLDFHVSAWTINDMAEPETMLPTWSNDGSQIYFPSTYHGSSILLSVSAHADGSGPQGGSQDAAQTVIGEGGVVGSFSFDRSQSRMAYFYGRMDDPGQIRVRDLATGQNRQLTQVNRDLLDGIDLGKVEEVWFKGPDGNDLQGWVMTPPGFDPSKKYPSIMEIHGGPLTQYGKYFMHEFYYLAASGYVVYFCNPRGGRGYGEAHAGAIWGDWGNHDYGDLMAWANYAEKLPYIDPQRMGVTGGSYGGYMTVWIIGHTQRFKAAVTMRCVSNFVSMWGSSDFNWTFQKELNNKPPFEDLQYVWDHSPIAYIGNAKTPTLVIHNEMDHRCPIEQGEQVYVALKRLGVDTEFVRFPDEFHGLSRNGRTDRRIARLKHIKRWFDKYME